MFKSLPFEARQLAATEARLQRIYDAAALGLKGDALALAAGMLPVEYRRLCQMDPMAAMAEAKGRADSEVEIATHLREAARNGDAKAALAILQHTHGWVAKQQVQVDVTQQISISAALREAESRVIDGRLVPSARAALSHAEDAMMLPEVSHAAAEQPTGAAR